MLRRPILALPILAAAAAMIPTTASAQKDPVYTGFLSNLALDGFDAVAYHTQGRPVEGDRSFEIEWNGADWRFVSAENRDLFLADPEAYAPQYGGYCAWAVTNGDLVRGDPEVWAIVDGRLFVNYDARIQSMWDGDRSGFITAADAVWPDVLAD